MIDIDQLSEEVKEVFPALTVEVEGGLPFAPSAGECLTIILRGDKSPNMDKAHQQLPFTIGAWQIHEPRGESEEWETHIMTHIEDIDYGY